LTNLAGTCKFDSVLLEAIDGALLVYGEASRSAFYEYFEKALRIAKHEIPARIEEFSKGLEGLFGLGSKSLEIMVMMQLHLKIGVVWEYTTPDQSTHYQRVLPDLTFKEYVVFAKKYFEETDNYEDQNCILVKEDEARAMYR
jgi:hypothetical protein